MPHSIFLPCTFYSMCISNPNHQVVPPARISLTLSRHFSLSFITFGKSSGLHPVSSQNCSMYVRAGRPAFAWPYAGFHRSTSLMSSSLLLIYIYIYIHTHHNKVKNYNFDILLNMCIYLQNIFSLKVNRKYAENSEGVKKHFIHRFTRKVIY